MLTGQLRIDTNEYLLTIIFIFLSFLPVIFSSVAAEQSVVNLIYLSLLALSIIMVLFQELSISKIGNTIFSTIFSFTIISFIMSETFNENLNYIVYLFLSLFFLKTIATSDTTTTSWMRWEFTTLLNCRMYSGSRLVSSGREAAYSMWPIAALPDSMNRSIRIAIPNSELASGDTRPPNSVPSPICVGSALSPTSTSETIGS